MCNDATREETMSIYKLPDSPYWHYDFVLRKKRYRGSTKKKVKYEAQTYERLLMERIRKQGDTFLTTAPTLEEFSTEFTEYVDKLDCTLETKRYYSSGIVMLKKTPLWTKKLDEI